MRCLHCHRFAALSVPDHKMYLGYEVQELGSKHLVDHIYYFSQSSMVYMLFPPHGIYECKVESYYHTSDTYLIKYIDGDVEVLSYADMKSLIPGTPEHQKTVANCAALHLAYTAAILQAQQLPNLQHKKPLTYKQA